MHIKALLEENRPVRPDVKNCDSTEHVDNERKVRW